MADVLDLNIVTPERLMVTEKVDQVNIPGSEGDMGILYDHAPILTTLRPGRLSYQKGDKTVSLVVSAGYAEVAANRVIVLAETAEFVDEVDRARAQAAKEKAEKRLGDPQLSDDEFQKAQRKLFRATARLESAEDKR
ncbi:MAG: F0F1 ATP synthase subunit epsilon [Nitrospinales bacterium]